MQQLNITEKMRKSVTRLKNDLQQYIVFSGTNSKYSLLINCHPDDQTVTLFKESPWHKQKLEMTIADFKLLLELGQEL